MRPDEEFAKEAFSRFLDGVGSASYKWEPGSEPPDYFLQAGDRRWAVEVTQVMENVNVGQYDMASEGVRQSLERFADRVEDQARRRGVLRGTYLLQLSPVQDLLDHAEIIMSGVMRYIEATKSEEAAEPQEIWWEDEITAVEIKKLDGDGAQVLPAVGGNPKWGGQIFHEASSLIQAAIRRKSGIGESIDLPIILLLIDAYDYADGGVWQASIKAIANHPFHTIARVFQEYQCQMLYSKNSTWFAAPGDGQIR